MAPRSTAADGPAGEVPPDASEPAGAGNDVDGRSARRLRNTEAAVDAILELLDEGTTAPTAQLVAERSGLSIRSIFRLFQDMGALHSAAIAHQEARVASLFHEVSTDGPLEARVATLVASRAELFEAVAPVRRHALRIAPGSPQIQAGLARSNRRFHRQLEVVFGAELAALSKASRGRGGCGRDVVLEALDAAASWETWDRLRSVQGLSATAAAAVMTQLLSARLTATAPFGEPAHPTATTASTP